MVSNISESTGHKMDIHKARNCSMDRKQVIKRSDQVWLIKEQTEKTN